LIGKPESRAAPAIAFPFAIAGASALLCLRLDAFACRAVGSRINRSYDFAAAFEHITGPTLDGTAAASFMPGASHEVLSPSAYQAAPRCPDLPGSGRSRLDVSLQEPALAGHP